MDLRISSMQGLAHRLLRHHLTLPVAMGMVSVLFILSAMKEYHQWRSLMDVGHAAPVFVPEKPASYAINQTRIANLFGAPEATNNKPLRKTNLRLQLVGSFVSADFKSSAAFIQTDGKPARRVTIGQEVVSEVHLAAVSTDHVLLKRNGVSEILSFPRVMEQVGIINPTDLPRTPLTTGHLSRIHGFNGNDARQKIQHLQQQLKKI